jgi:hypothetical protein
VSELLGEIVTWDLASLTVPYDRVVSALSESGLPLEAATDLRPQTAFSRACREFREDRTIDRIKREGDAVTFQFTRKALEDNGLLGFDYECLVHLDTASGTITCPESPDIEEAATRLFAEALRQRNTNDITRMVQGLFQAHADLYPINPRKGVAYFVPEKFRDFSGRCETFLTSLGGKLLRFPVPKGTAEGNRSVKDSVEGGLSTLVDELAAAVDSWDEHTRESTFEKAVEKWTTVRHKAEAYSEYLGEKQAGLLARLDAEKSRLAAKVSALAIAKETAKNDGQPSLFPPVETEEPTTV